MLARLVGAFLDFIADVAMSSTRKGNLIPREDDLEPVRERVANDLLNYGPCKCMDCVCGFNKTDPHTRPGRGVE